MHGERYGERERERGVLCECQFRVFSSLREKAVPQSACAGSDTA